MNTKLEKKLAEEFPFMRRDPAALKQKYITDLYGAFGIECGDGWYGLIREMCAEITQVYVDLGIECCFNPIQIKEKYGTLRVYFGAENDEAHDKILQITFKYDKKSETVCEKCGEPGKMREVNSWFSVKCDKCYTDLLSRYYPNTNIDRLLEVLEKVDKYVKEGLTEAEAVNKLREEYEDILE